MTFCFLFTAAASPWVLLVYWAFSYWLVFGEFFLNNFLFDLGLASKDVITGLCSQKKAIVTPAHMLCFVTNTVFF